MPFYIILTTFRVLSISIAVVALQWICLLIYPVLFLTIIIIGYKKTSNGKDFLTRGLISGLTTGMLCCWVWTIPFSPHSCFSWSPVWRWTFVPNLLAGSESCHHSLMRTGSWHWLHLSTWTQIQPGFYQHLNRRNLHWHSLFCFVLLVTNKRREGSSPCLKRRSESNESTKKAVWESPWRYWSRECAAVRIQKRF